jgi:CBS domain-containing protein
MSVTRQVLDAIGIDGGSRRRLRRPLGGGLARGRGPYLWLGAAAAATAAAAWLGQRSARARTGKVRDVMIPHVVTIHADATLVEAAHRMKEANVGVLPVVEGGVLRGIVTDRDLVVRAIAEGADPARTRVVECATRDLVCARPDSPLEEAMEVMAECQIGRLPVVDEGNRVVGIVTLSSMALRSRESDEALDTAREVSRRSARQA